MDAKLIIRFTAAYIPHNKNIKKGFFTIASKLVAKMDNTKQNGIK